MFIDHWLFQSWLWKKMWVKTQQNPRRYMKKWLRKWARDFQPIQPDPCSSCFLAGLGCHQAGQSDHWSGLGMDVMLPWIESAPCWWVGRFVVFYCWWFFVEFWWWFGQPRQIYIYLYRYLFFWRCWILNSWSQHFLRRMGFEYFSISKKGPTIFAKWCVADRFPGFPKSW